ncbi:NADPH-dependent F420 reductase [Streptomyces sp. NPDC056704]|uniref:NADPH-dependent F420 reductase n=1 Tax=Streptomyces sp. NPDC056704 TaxID=3345917 RepID=UPI0036C1F3A2
MTKTIGFIGSGSIGGSLARLAVAAGLNVVMSNSRGPETLADLIAELGDRARAATTEEAARAGDIVVATVPMSAYDKLPADGLAGKTVIDTMNYYPERDGHIAELDSAEVTSSELLQRHLAGSRVVKTLHNMDWLRLYSRARPAGAPDRSTLPVAGDDPAAKAEVIGLMDVLGYDAVDIGTLADSWRCEPGTPVYVWPYLGERPEGITKEEAQRWFQEGPGEPVSADRVNELVDQAVRGPVGGSFAALPFWG